MKWEEGARLTRIHRLVAEEVSVTNGGDDAFSGTS